MTVHGDHLAGPVGDFQLWGVFADEVSGEELQEIDQLPVFELWE